MSGSKRRIKRNMYKTHINPLLAQTKIEHSRDVMLLLDPPPPTRPRDEREDVFKVGMRLPITKEMWEDK